MTTATISRPPAGTGLWKTAQGLGLLLTVILLAGLLTRPDLTLNVLWNAVVPVLPAVFLVSTAIWRNVCPLATLTMLPGGRFGARTIREGTIRATLIAGVGLLLVLVPARRFMFNTDGVALAATIAAVAILALGGGFRFKRKAGFCNTICPVLPVERLYGQRPLLQVANVRCTPCIGCTERGCIDLSPADSARTAVGPRWGGTWLFSPFGLFAAAFPGFIFGYYTIANGPLHQAVVVYRQVLLAMAVSAAAVTLLVTVFRIGAAVALPVLAALAVGLYYWYAAAVVAEAWGITGIPTWSIRIAALALILTWLPRALRPAEPAPSWPR
ncbi:MAG TPA: hypothetical protein VI383_02725 [Gemmatimonadales bacterium]|nr:hypothetical protein [Gemmatimonadales bacterium]